MGSLTTSWVLEVPTKISAGLILGLSYKDVEAVVSSKAIIIEGVAMNTIKTVSIDGENRRIGFC
jgi:hypothetical protein